LLAKIDLDMGPTKGPDAPAGIGAFSFPQGEKKMILLKMPGDLDSQRAAATIPKPAREALRRRLEAWLREIRRHDPEAVPVPDRDGLFAFLEPGETAVDLPGEGWPRPLAQMPFEAVQFDAQARAFFCHFVPSNS
jgi:hypothetical protein